MKILILAGGHGTRLWPVSVQKKPKQLLKLIGNKTLIENTVQRSSQWVGEKNLYIGTTEVLAKAIQQHVPEVPLNHYSLEPVMRDRCAALALACSIIAKHDSTATVFTMWSDHEIKEKNKGYFKKLIKEADAFLKKNHTAVLTVGVTPDFPSTAYGYIKFGKRKTGSKPELFTLESFKEKPDGETAAQYIATKKYLWNTGYFMFSVQHMLHLFETLTPELFEVLQKITPHIGTKKQSWAIKKYFPEMPKLDFESAIIEKINQDIYTIKGDFTWADIGSWKTVKDVQTAKAQNLFKAKNHIDHGSESSMVYSDLPHLITTVKLKDIAIIQTKTTTLVADINASEEVKHIIKKLKENPNLLKYL